MSAIDDFREITIKVLAFMDSTDDGKALSKKFNSAIQEMFASFDAGVSILLQTIQVQKTMLGLQHALLKECANPESSAKSRLKLKIRSEAIIDQLRKGIEYMPNADREALNDQFDRYVAWLNNIQKLNDDEDSEL